MITPNNRTGIIILFLIQKDTLFHTSGFQSRVSRPAALALLQNSLKCKFLGSNPNLQNQKLLRVGLGDLRFNSSSRGFLCTLKVVTTALYYARPMRSASLGGRPGITILIKWPKMTLMSSQVWNLQHHEHHLGTAAALWVGSNPLSLGWDSKVALLSDLTSSRDSNTDFTAGLRFKSSPWLTPWFGSGILPTSGYTFSIFSNRLLVY